MSVDLKYKDMKKALLIIGMIVIFFAGCKKDDILEASKVEMKDVTMERGWEHVKMSGEYSYPQALEGMKIIVSSNENMSESVEYVCALEGKKFDVTIDNLEAGVTYYYRYEYDNGYDKARGDKENFVTVRKPIVVTNNVVNITMNSAVLSGSVTNNDVENKINVRGFCWSKNTNPTISGSHNNNGSSSGTGTSSFTYNLSYLESNTKYYVRTYARTDWGVVYGEVKSFVTKGEEPEVPNENGYEYVDLGLPSGLKWATCNVGATKPEGYGNYYAWGETKTKVSYISSNSLNYGKQMNDISGNSKYDVATANWGGNWRMPTKAELEELKNNCTWTYTIQNGAYGFKIKSKTNSNSIFLPVGGPIVDGCNGGTYWSSTPYEYGNLEAFILNFVNHNPDIYSHYRYNGRPVRPVFGGNFTGPEEQPEDEPEEPEIVLPTVTTNSVTNITSNSATCGGNVTSDGNGTVTARGICWSETSEPKINNLYSEESNNGTGTGSFTSALTNLKANTTYYVRAYATNEAGTSYGEVKNFKTLEEEPEETISGTENGHNYVDLGLPSGLKWATCNVGASSPEEYGGYYAWGETTTKTEYTEENCLTCGKQMNDISGNAQYDAATANWGGAWRMPTYDELNELNTQCTWTWTTQDGVNGYKVTGPSGASIFLPAAGSREEALLVLAGSCGSYWSSTHSKNFDDYAHILSINSDEHALISISLYCYGRPVRPVFGGNFTGPEEQPEIVLPTVSTNSVSSITANTAICGGNVTSDGGGTVSARGICWSETSEPKINNLYSEESNEGTGTGSFTSSMTNLKANTTYYVRAYATNEAGTVYGEVKSFMTLEEEPEETISGTENGHDWVDLGLPSGLKWATCNVGANSPEEYGDYFAWGETTTKSDYSSSNCPTYGLGISQLQSQGYIDSEGNLTSQYDAATANWGGNWRMPTKAEQKELINNCTWIWTTQNGVNGYNVEGPNGNSIFLPVAGYRLRSSLYKAGSGGYYWSSTPEEDYDYLAYYLYFGSDDLYMASYGRDKGLSVRPILE